VNVDAIPPFLRRMILAWTLALVSGTAAVQLGNYGWEHVARPQPLEELSYYPTGRHLMPVTLGHSETAADLAWLRAVQYYGAHRMSDNQFTRMEHVFDVLTSLAPNFVPAYVFGGFALAQEGRDFDAASRLMLKGLEANPRSGTLAFQLGFLYYVRPGGRALRRAAEMFERAARQPDAPPQAARFAAYARQHSGDLRVALELWTRVAQDTPNHYLREMAQHEIDRIQAAVAAGRPQQVVRSLPVPQVILTAPR
jgi:tetratricopeptide (TPR) repeat protein